MHLKFQLCLLLITVLIPQHSWAYKPKTGHKIISAIALDYYNGCVNELKDTITPALVQIKGNKEDEESDFAKILQYNIDEDESIWGYPRRLINWHFFRTSIRERKSAMFGLLDKSMSRLVNGIYNEIVPTKGDSPEEYRLSQAKINKLTGRLMHFIEDVTVPAHVTPVWHGPFVSDEFDAIPVSATSVIKELNKLFPNECYVIEAKLLNTASFEATKEITNPLIKILDETSQKTFTSISSEACKTIDEESYDWRIFWTPPSKEDGGNYFGSYTSCKISLKAEDEYGNEQVVIQDVSSYVPQNTCEKPHDKERYKVCIVTKKKIENYVTQQHVSAVKADVQALFWLSRNILRVNKNATKHQ